jgi:hypothetical protein
VFDDWREQPLPALSAAVGDAVATALGATRRPDLSDEPLAAALRYWSDLLEGHVYVILDQLEELFVYQREGNGPGAFVTDFAAAVDARDLDVSFLLSIREDALAKLDVFKAGIPDVLGNYLRLEALDEVGARAAIVKPIASYNELVPSDCPASIDEELVEAVLAGLTNGAAGMRAPPSPTARNHVEAAHLQLVMQRLWDAEQQAGSHHLRRETLAHLGDAREILHAHLLEALPTEPDDQDVAAEIFRFLVTSAAQLTQFSDIPEERIQRVLDRLAREDARILRPVSSSSADAPRYELVHDVLAQPVREWRIAHVAQRGATRRERERTRRRIAYLARTVGVVVAVAIIGLAALAWRQRDEAQRQARNARSARVLTAKANENLKKANDSLNAVNDLLGNSNRAKGAIVSGLLLVQRVKSMVGHTTGHQLRVLDFQFGGGRPVAYQIQFEPSGATSLLYQYAKIWVWPTDRQGRVHGTIRHGAMVTAHSQLAQGASERSGVFWRPVPPNGCDGAKAYIVRHRGHPRARINFLWNANACYTYPPDWSVVNSTLMRLSHA